MEAGGSLSPDLLGARPCVLDEAQVALLEVGSSLARRPVSRPAPAELTVYFLL